MLTEGLELCISTTSASIRFTLSLVSWLISGTAVAIVLVFSAYTLSDRHGPGMVLTVPFVIFGLVRYLHLADAGQGEEPERARSATRHSVSA